MSQPFADRRQAGRLLARRLAAYAQRRDVIVLALPRGGVPVGHEVASALGVPFDVFIVRKIGVPWNEEVAIGAVASGGEWLLDTASIRDLRISRDEVARLTTKAVRELDRRERLYRGHRPPLELYGKIVILVDDGLATGASMLAAVKAVRHQSPSAIVVATPVAPESTCLALRAVADACLALEHPSPFYGVGRHYMDFTQTSDEEVLALLAQPTTQRTVAAATR